VSAPINDGGPAFPVSLPGWGDNGASGMTRRDYFAGQALAGMGALIKQIRPGDEEVVAIAAYAMADAMIAVCAKGGVE
jgi:hypothetical protein